MSYDPQIAQWFQAVDADRSGRITSSELQAALMSSNGRKFNDTACRLMIGNTTSTAVFGDSKLKLWWWNFMQDYSMEVPERLTCKDLDSFTIT